VRARLIRSHLETFDRQKTTGQGWFEVRYDDEVVCGWRRFDGIYEEPMT